MHIAFQGATGAYSESAAMRGWPGCTTLALERFEDVFEAVQAGRVTYGILPIENSVGGSIHRNYDLLLEHDLPIVGETELTVVHNLLALPGTPIEAIRRVFSHPQALAQTERFVRTLPGVEVVATYDTAGSARLIREGNLGDTAAIASARAAEAFGLEVLRAGIQDFEDNITRFILVSRDPQPLGRADKTTLAFTLHNAPGALFKALSVFALRDIDLTKLESRPARGLPWEYLFYVDVSVGRDDVRCTRAIGHLTESAQWVRTLGSYARWTGEPQPVEAIPSAR
jgi:arogenate/prephenate dehydratase